VFQGFNLLARTSALENVELPLIYRQYPRSQRVALARRALSIVGLADRARHHPNELSGGQQQRVAIARALVSDPQVLFADEPTGNLDTTSSTEIMTFLENLNQEHGITIVLVTHEEEVARFARRSINFVDGRLLAVPAGSGGEQ
jgi:putative ABC transport system ATP-binding protein